MPSRRLYYPTVLLLGCLCLALLLYTIPAGAYDSDQYLDEPLKESVDSDTPAAGLSQQKAAAQENESGTYWFLLKLAGGLALVVGGIWGVGKLLHRSGFGGGSNRFKSVLSTLPIQSNQYLQITRIGSRYLVLGITGESISKICELEDPELIQELKLNRDEENGQEQSNKFSDVLQRFLGGMQSSFKKEQKSSQFEDVEQKLRDLKEAGESEQ